MQNPLVLIDGSSYFFRAFHALPPLNNSKGQPTGAVYGVVNMIKKIIKDYQPQQIAVVFDAKGKTFRDYIYPEYKANRPPMPDDLSSQFQPMIDVLDAMGLPLLIIEGVEADDVIGTLAHIATEQKREVVISTGDKDMAQLVNDHVTLINTMTGKTMDKDGVVEKFGVTPEQIIDYLALVGDKVDNVPGVEKCGPKTAVKWLTEYKTLEEVIKNSDQIKGKVGEYLRRDTQHLPLSKELVTIKCDVNLGISLDDLTPQAADKIRLTNLVKELEFKSWLKELLAEDEKAPEVEKNYQTLRSETELNAWLKAIKHAPYFAFDTETNSLDAISAEIVGVSLSIEANQAAYIPLAHVDDEHQLDREAVLAELKPILEDENIAKVGQNLKYDYSVLRNHDICMQGIKFDTMLESYVLNSGGGRHDMDTLALKYLGHKTISFSEVAGKGAKQLSFDQIPVDKASEYAAEDADITLQLHQTLHPQLDEKLKSVFDDIEMPLVTVLAEMERTGVLIDCDELQAQSEILKKRIEELEAKAFKLADTSFNMNSPKQLQEILYTKLSLPILQKTPKGQPSTAEPVLQELAFDYPLPKVILEYRSLSKLVSTYIDALPKRVNPKTGRVHTSYNQAVTATGRLSSSDPNLQNIPIRTEAGREVRKAFIAAEGHNLLAADYSQIELRIMAHLSQDEGLLNAFANGWDIHTATASEIFDVPIDEVSPEQRRRSKAVNFGLIYGMSAFGLAKQLGVERADAQQYMDIYFARYPGVKQYMEDTRQQAHRDGYVETLFGRRLNLPEINSRNIMRKKAAERTAINAPMQGTAADIIKKTMIATHDWIKNSSLSVKMIMQVHDELVFEIAEHDLEKAKQEIIRLMETTVELSVPLKVSVGVGTNWEEAH
jgi:DNA polymerase-1